MERVSSDIGFFNWCEAFNDQSVRAAFVNVEPDVILAVVLDCDQELIVDRAAMETVTGFVGLNVVSAIEISRVIEFEAQTPGFSSVFLFDPDALWICHGLIEDIEVHLVGEARFGGCHLIHSPFWR